MSNTSIYYVYAYLREDGAPYYIGKGKGKRIHARHSVDLPPEERRIFIKTELSESDAFALEIQLINQWGRLDKGSGILMNKTNGGQGFSGRKGKHIKPLSKQHREKLSLANKDKPKSEETKAKMRGPKSEEHRANLRGPRGSRGPQKNPCKTRKSRGPRGPMSEETKAKMRGPRGPMSEEHKALRRKPRKNKQE
jgi:hypothetical protein